MRTTAQLLVAFALFTPTLVFGAPVPKEKEKPNAEKVLGKWKLTKSSNDGEKSETLIVEFTKDGKMTITQGEGEAKFVFSGTYKVEGDKLPYKMTMPGGDKKAETLTIKKLTDEELIFVDPDEIQEDFKRVVEKKEK